MKINPIRKIIKDFLPWTQHNDNHHVNQMFFNYESRAIYNNGLIVYKIQHNKYCTELLKSVPRQYSIITKGTVLKNSKHNFVNFQFKSMVYYSDPKYIFESFGYKQVSNQIFSSTDYNLQRIYNISSPIPTVYKSASIKGRNIFRSQRYLISCSLSFKIVWLISLLNSSLLMYKSIARSKFLRKI